MSAWIRKANVADIDAVAELYGELCDDLQANGSPAGACWRRDGYPTREEAEEAYEKGALYVAEVDGEIAGAAVYQNGSEDAHETVQWRTGDDAKVVVLHLLTVHPKFKRHGIGTQLLQHAEIIAKELGAQSVRLDTYVDNVPAISLYEKHGYVYCGLVDLGLEEFGCKWFRAYEKIL